MQGNSNILYDLDSNGNVTRRRVVANDGTIKYEQYDASTKKTTNWKETAYEEARQAITDASSITEQGVMIAQYLQKHPSDARFEAAMSMLNSKNISIVESVLNKPIEQWAQINTDINKDMQIDLQRKLAIVRRAQNATRNLANIDIENATAEDFKNAISGLTPTDMGYIEEYLGTPINLYLAQRGWSEDDKNIIKRQFAMK